MSSLWTPGGEVPVSRRGAESAPTAPPPEASDDAYEGPYEELSEEEAAQLAAMQHDLLETPVAAIVANHAVGLFQLAGLHLSTDPVNLGEARIAIDAMGGLLEGVKGRLGPDEPALFDALHQIRMAYVQIHNAQAGPAAQ